jgi:hypothetical protein
MQAKAKTDGSVMFANSDPRMIRLFLRFLRRFFDIDESRLRVRLHLHAGLDLGAATRFWSQVTGVPSAVPEAVSCGTGSVDTAVEASDALPGRYSCSTTHRAIMGLVAGLLSSDVRSPG